MSATTQYSLTTDDALQVRIAPECMDQVAQWLPHSARPIASGSAPLLVDITSEPAFSRMLIPDSHSAHLEHTRCEVGGDHAAIYGEGVTGRVDLANGRAELRLDNAAGLAAIVSSLNFCVSLLLARCNRYLVHAAAVADARGSVWLLAGDSHAGKTTTTINLARAGWQLLSDDHIVIQRTAAGWIAEGWTRPMHVDAGWTEGRPVGYRIAMTPAMVGLTVLSSGRVGGVLLPRVAANAASTTVTEAPSSAALSTLLRQTAWSLLDPSVASIALRDLAEIASLPAYTMVLAPDTFRDGERLISKMSEAMAGV